MFCGQLVAEFICYWPLAVPARAMPVFDFLCYLKNEIN